MNKMPKIQLNEMADEIELHLNNEGSLDVHQVETEKILKSALSHADSERNFLPDKDKFALFLKSLTPDVLIPETNTVTGEDSSGLDDKATWFTLNKSFTYSMFSLVVVLLMLVTFLDRTTYSHRESVLNDSESVHFSDISSNVGVKNTKKIASNNPTSSTATPIPTPTESQTSQQENAQLFSANRMMASNTDDSVKTNNLNATDESMSSELSASQSESEIDKSSLNDPEFATPANIDDPIS